jgi:hypothetical protein
MLKLHQGKISFLKAWDWVITADLRCEQRDKLAGLDNFIQTPNIVEIKTCDLDGHTKIENMSINELWHVAVDKNGHIDSDRHKEIRAVYRAKILNRYVTIIIGSLGSIIGLVGGILGIIVFFTR